MLKNLSKINLITLTFLIFSPVILFAQSNYISLSGHGLLDGNPSTGSLASFFDIMYKLGVSVASVLAIVYIFYAGFIYTTSSSSDGKSNAKRRIQAAIGGLLLALGSYIILRTINPQLVYVNLGFDSVSSRQIEADIVSEEARQNMLRKQLFIQEEKTSYENAIDQSILVANTNGSVGGNVPQAVWTGSGYQAGTTHTEPSQVEALINIPIRGAFNQTQKNALGGDGVEPHTQSVVHNGSIWAKGTASRFGGPNDSGVSQTETTALYGDVILKKIDISKRYVALRFDWTKMSKASTMGKCVQVHNPATGDTALASPLDWGPNSIVTGKSIDISPGLSAALGFGSANDRSFMSSGGGIETGAPLFFRLVDGNCERPSSAWNIY